MRLAWAGPRLRLGTRIAAMTAVALLAVEALNAAVFVLIPARVLRPYSAHWFIAKSEEAALAIFQAEAKARDSLSARLGADNNLDIRWQRTWEEGAEESNKFLRPFLERARMAIETDLKGKARKVAAKGGFRLRGNILHVDVLPQPPDFISRLASGPLRPEEADLALLAPFEFAIQGLDGSWVTVAPQGMPSYWARVLPWFIILLGVAAMISLYSVIAAKRSLRPLERLAEAADNFGRTRQAAPIEPTGLREFEVIARAMNEMQERIKQFIDERTHMLAAMSHDLRTNLTGLRLDAEELADGETKDRLIEGMGEMERMISATLAFAGDDLKNEPTQMIDLAALLISLCDGFSDRNCSASYSGPDHLFAICQPVAIKRAFNNLFDNAIKYGGCARVQLAQSAGRAAISIADDGPGIPLDKARLAFQPFQRLDTSRNRETGGVGLGLTIARDIVQSHGGEIGLGVPPQGRGLEVRISLPLPSLRGTQEHLSAH
jgi:signal transduction histidine kinase